MGKRSGWTGIVWNVLMASCLISAVAHADEPEPPGTVTVKRYKDPGKVPYRAVRAAYDVLDKNAARVPGAMLRYSLVPFIPADTAKDVSIRLISDHDVKYLPLDASLSFEIPRLPSGDDDDWVLLIEIHLNKVPESQRFVDSSLMSPGTTDSSRRLGDLRVQCEMAAAWNRARLPLVVRMLASVKTSTCGRKQGTRFIARRPVAKIRLVADGRVAEIANPLSASKDMRYLVPLGDSSWPDDTRVNLVYADEAPATELTPTQP